MADKGKTLYVSDLDGTLLTGEITLSPFTRQTLNDFIARGGLFTYASARSFSSAHRAVEGLRFQLPVAIYNGTMLADPDTGVPVWSCTMRPDDAVRALTALTARGQSPIVYAFIDGSEYASWLTCGRNEGMARYIASRPGDPRNRPLTDPARLLDGDIFYMMLIETEETVNALSRLFADDPAFTMHTLEDTYNRGEYWLELSAAGTGKDRAVLRLKEMLGAERVVCFGDNLNDMAMFSACDACYAVENAMPALKAIASGVIPANVEDGVARFILDAEGAAN